MSRLCCSCGNPAFSHSFGLSTSGPQVRHLKSADSCAILVTVVTFPSVRALNMLTVARMRQGGATSSQLSSLVEVEAAEVLTVTRMGQRVRHPCTYVTSYACTSCVHINFVHPRHVHSQSCLAEPETARMLQPEPGTSQYEYAGTPRAWEDVSHVSLLKILLPDARKDGLTPAEPARTSLGLSLWGWGVGVEAKAKEVLAKCRT